MLATGGGLVFTGKLTGEFLALDADTGKTLRQFQTSSGVNSTNRAVNGHVPTGGSPWTFALMPE